MIKLFAKWTFGNFGHALTMLSFASKILKPPVDSLSARVNSGALILMFV